MRTDEPHNERRGCVSRRELSPGFAIKVSTAGADECRPQAKLINVNESVIEPQRAEASSAGLTASRFSVAARRRWRWPVQRVQWFVQ